MAWDTSFLKNSLYSLFGVDVVRVDDGRVQQFDQLRAAMLACLEKADVNNHAPALQRRVAYAKDVQTLWYLRADLMGVLASHCGETTARAQLDCITLQFKGLLPKGLIARSSPLRI